MRALIALAATSLSLLTGCQTVIQQGGTPNLKNEQVRIFLPPFTNATDDEHAGRALTEITATALYQRGLPISQTEPVLSRSRLENASGADGLYLDNARALNATHLLVGTVHEYRYKTDLDGDPVVGITLRLVDVRNGLTLWQGSSANVSVLFGSLTRASQKAVRQLVSKIPVESLGASDPGAASAASTGTPAPGSAAPRP